MQPELLVAQALPVAVSLPRQQPPTSTTGRDRLADTLATYDPVLTDVGKYDKDLPHHLAERLLRILLSNPRAAASMVNAAGPCTLSSTRDATSPAHKGYSIDSSESTTSAHRRWHNAGGKRSRKISRRLRTCAFGGSTALWKPNHQE